jgi:hypothetical protein
LESSGRLAESATALFGDARTADAANASAAPVFHIDSAYQGQDGVAMICRARDDQRAEARLSATAEKAQRPGRGEFAQLS